MATGTLAVFTGVFFLQPETIRLTATTAVRETYAKLILIPARWQGFHYIARPASTTLQFPDILVTHSGSYSPGKGRSSLDQQGERDQPLCRTMGPKGPLAMSKFILALALSAFAYAQQQPPSAAQLKQEAESTPQSLDAQSNYIRYVAEEARRVPTNQDALFKSLRDNYEGWAKRTPDSAVLQWALGVVCQMMNDDAAAAHFEASVKLDPKFIPGHKGLTAYAAAHNDVATHRRGLLKSIELNPKDIASGYDYITTFYHEDRAKFFELAEQYIAKNPESAPSAALLTALADAQPDDAQRTVYREKILQTYVRNGKPWQNLTIPMRALFETYNGTDPAKFVDYTKSENNRSSLIPVNEPAARR